MSEFFSQLREFSARVFKHLGIDEWISPWHSEVARGDYPTGVILHYTAGDTLIGAVQWFMVRRYQAHVSAHLVVGRGWPAGWRVFAEGLDQIEKLPVVVVECVPPDRVAWHATWTNSTHYGIEIVNEGEVHKTARGEFYWGSDKRFSGEPVQVGEKYWAPYTEDQLSTVVTVLRKIVQAFPRILSYAIFGHEHVSRVKHDPGPAFPIHDVRRAAYGSEISIQECLAPGYGDSWRRERARALMRDVLGRNISPEEAWVSVSRAFHHGFCTGEFDFWPLGSLGLELLGYPVTVPLDSAVIRVFQRMMRIAIDGVPGEQTRAALVQRLSECGILGGARDV